MIIIRGEDVILSQLLGEPPKTSIWRRRDDDVAKAPSTPNGRYPPLLFGPILDPKSSILKTCCSAPTGSTKTHVS